MTGALPADIDLMPKSIRRGRLGAVAAAGALLFVPAAAEAEHPVARPSSAASQGAALFQRVQQSYVNVPGVKITVDYGGVSRWFTDVLNQGKVVSEWYYSLDVAGVSQLVSLNGSPTYEQRDPATCWRVLPRSSPQTLTDVGHAVVNLTKAMTITNLRALSGGWLLTVKERGSVAQFRIGKTLRIQSITLTSGKKRVVETVAALTETPNLPTPKPTCL